MNCYEQFDELFSLWRAEVPNEYFMEDGLMILPGKTEEEMDSLWKCSPIRMAFLDKDNNQENARYNDFAQKLADITIWSGTISVIIHSFL